MTETYQTFNENSLDRHKAADIVREVKKHPQEVLASFTGNFEDEGSVAFLEERAELLAILNGEHEPEPHDLDEASEAGLFLDKLMEKLPEFYEDRVLIKENLGSNVVNLADYRTKKIVTLQENQGPIDSIVSVRESSPNHDQDWQPQALVVETVLRGTVEVGCYRVCKEANQDDFDVFHVIPKYRNRMKTEEVIQVTDQAKKHAILQEFTRSLLGAVENPSKQDDKIAQVKALEPATLVL